MEYQAQSGDCHFKKNVEKLVRIQEQAAKMIQGLKSKLYKVRLKELGMF